MTLSNPGSIYDYSVTPINNQTADASQNWQEFQDPATVNNSARQGMARLAEFLDDLAPTRASTWVVPNAYLVASAVLPAGASLPDGFIISFIAHATNTGAATLAVGTFASIALRGQTGVSLAAGMIQAGQKLTCYFRSSTNEFIADGTGAMSAAYSAAFTSSDITARIFKVGMIGTWPTEVIPSGWLECNGAEISRTAYPELFVAYGTRYGAGDGSTTFKIPDYRGRFLRAWAHGQVSDPDAALRTARGDGSTGDIVGSQQPWQVQTHTHTGTTDTSGAHTHTTDHPLLGSPTTGGASGGGLGVPTTSVTIQSAGSHTHTFTTNGSGSAQSNPINVSVVYCCLALPAAAAAGTLGVNGLQYVFGSYSAAAVDPGAGMVAVSGANLNPTSTGTIYLSAQEATTANVGAYLAALPSGQVLKINRVGGLATFAIVSLTTSFSSSGTYYSASYSVIASGSTFAGGDQVGVLVSGVPGANGTTVPDISGLTEKTLVDDAADFGIVYDTAGAAHKKFKPKNIGYTSPLAGAVLQTINRRLSMEIYATDFGVKFDGSVADETTALQAAINATAVGGTLFLPAGVCKLIGSGTSILTIPNPIVIKGQNQATVLQVDLTVPTTRKLFSAVINTAVAGYGFRDFFVEPSSGSVLSCGTVIAFDFTGATTAQAYDTHIDNVKIWQAGGGATGFYSIYAVCLSSSTTGGLAYSTIERCNLESVRLEYQGDSNTVASNVIGGINESVYSSQITGAGNLRVVLNNLTGARGNVIDSGIAPVFAFNECEMPSGTGSANGAIIDISGAIARVEKPVIMGNTSQAIAGTAIPVRIGNASGANVASNRMTIPSAYSHVKIESTASRAKVADDNQYQTASIVVAGTITDASSSTRKVGQVLVMPQGRLTLTSATPVLSSTVTGATTVYYTPDSGTQCPLYDGVLWYTADVAEVSQTTTDATKSPAACAASSVYDVLIWNDAGTIRATRSAAWTSTTARGTGAGTAELQRVNGIYTNKYAVTNGPAAGLGTYVGSIATNGSSQVDWILGTSATGGGAAWLGVYSHYNQRKFNTRVSDPTASWTYTQGVAGTWRAADNSATFRATILQGLPSETVDLSYLCTSSANTGGNAAGIGIGSTTVNSALVGQVPGGSTLGVTATLETVHTGMQFYAAIETAGYTTAATYYGVNSGAFYNNGLTATFKA